MSFIIVNFGYKQSKILGINCQVAPLLDAAHKLAIADANKAMASKEEQFNKLLEDIVNRQKAAQDRLEILNNPPPEDESKRQAARPPKKKPEEDASAVNTTESKAEAPPVKEETKASPNKKMNAKEKKAAEEERKKTLAAQAKEEPAVPEVSQEELKQQRIEAEKVTLDATIKESEVLLDSIGKKMIQLKKEKQKLNAPMTEFDLTDRAGDRKYLKTKMEEYANTVLAPKGQYSLVSINEEQEIEPFAIDGYAMRTPEEDETHVEEAVDPKKGAVKGKKK